MLGIAYCLYLVVLAVLPTAVCWRWGLPSSLAVALAALVLVAVVAYQIDIGTPATSLGPLPEHNVLEHINRVQGERMGQAFAVYAIFGVIPAATLALGVVAAVILALFSRARGPRQA